MRKNILNKALLALFVLAVMISGCGARKNLVSAPVPGVTSATADKEKARAERLSAIEGKRVAFTTLNGRAKAQLAIGDKRNEVTMNIRIRNNEAIWVSVTAIAGLEVARAMITPDSVKVINRLENEYIRKPFSYIYEFTSERINFSTLQAVLTGGIMPGFVDNSTEVELRGQTTFLKSIIGSLVYVLQTNEQDNVTVTSLSDTAAGQSLKVEYADFQTVSRQSVPHTVSLSSRAGNKNISLNLEFSRLELDGPADMPFRVPDRFLIKN